MALPRHELQAGATLLRLISLWQEHTSVGHDIFFWKVISHRAAQTRAAEKPRRDAFTAEAQTKVAVP